MLLRWKPEKRHQREVDIWHRRNRW